MGILHEHLAQDAGAATGRNARSWRLKLYTVDGPLSFVLADVTERAKVWPALNLNAAILRMERVRFIDRMGLACLSSLMTRLEALGIPVVLCGANAEVKSRLVGAGLDHFHDKVSYCDDISILL